MFGISVLLSIVAYAPSQNPQANWVAENYTKQEILVPMRDGVRLFTQIYAPKDTSSSYPIMMVRTPYSVAPYGERLRTALGPEPQFGWDKYIFVYQDVRGRYMSEGEHVYSPPHKPNKGPKDFDESTDAYDTIDWLLKNVPNHNGKVGIWGVSQPGFYASNALINSHPALVAVSPQAPVTDRFVGDDDHHNGAFFLAQRYSFMSNFGVPRPEPTQRPEAIFRYSTRDIYEYFLEMGPLENAQKLFQNKNKFWNQTMEHEAYDEFWKSRSVPQHLKGVKPAVLVIGGWFDSEDLYGALTTYGAIERQNPGVVNHLLMGPWSHGGWNGTGERLGAMEFGSRTGDEYRKLQRDFFMYYLKGFGKLELPEARTFNTGSNVWRSFEQWPPKDARKSSLWFGRDGSLLYSENRPVGRDGHKEIVSDPAKPVPFIGFPTSGVPSAFMVEDQRFAAGRPDVVVFQTEPLKEDLTLAGPIQADLWVSTTGTDSDWIVKVIDVHPSDAAENTAVNPPVKLADYQMLIRAEVMRGKFRNSLEKPEPFVPGKPTPVKFVLQDLLHTFRKGHRIMVQVQCSWFPLVDRNPQQFVNIPKAKAEDFKPATQRVYFTKEHPSRLSVGVLR